MSIHIVDLGKMNYREALAIQERLLARRQANEIGDTLLLVEHPATLTLGTRGQRANILASPEHLAQNGIEIFEVNRGGDVTYHGPGQIVGYPIMNLSCVENDIKRFIWNLEEVFIRLLSEEYDIVATREDKKYTGVWVNVPAGIGAAGAPECGAASDGTVTTGEGMSEGTSEKAGADMAGAGTTGAAREKKITAIGIAVKKWVTMHGFAFNVNTNLDHFNLINPCGITDRGVTSLQQLTGVEQNLLSLKLKVAQTFCTVFGRRVNPTKLDELLGEETEG